MRQSYHETMSSARHVGVVLFTLVVAVVAAGAAVGPASAQSTQGPTPIDSCRTIADDGTYVLTSDINNSSDPVCIQILSSDVVFDGRGHTIETGTNNTESVGVKANNSLTTLSNVTVRNVSTTGWTAGIYYLAANDGTIRNVNTSANRRHGVLLRASSDTRLENVTAVGNERWDLYSVGNATNTTASGFETASSTTSFTASNVALTGIASPPGDPPNRTSIGRSLGAAASGPNASLRLSMQYTDENVTDAGVTESTLRMWAFDGTWAARPGVNYVNIKRNRVVTNVPRLTNATVFAPMGIVETPTPTAAANGTTSGPAADGGNTATNATTSSENGPGFGVALALFSLLASAFLALRRR